MRVWIRCCLKTPSIDVIRQAIKIIHVTNKEVEYEALIIGLDISQNQRHETLEARYDSLLVVNHINGAFEVRQML